MPNIVYSIKFDTYWSSGNNVKRNKTEIFAGNDEKIDINETIAFLFIVSFIAFKLLRRKVNDNVFMLLNKYGSNCFYDEVTTAWQNLLAPEHVIKIGEEKAIVDLMLGIISMLSASRDLESYKIDMKDRGQTKERIEGVSSSLKGLSTALVPVKVNGTITKTSSNNKTTQRGRRL